MKCTSTGVKAWAEQVEKAYDKLYKHCARQRNDTVAAKKLSTLYVQYTLAKRREEFSFQILQSRPHRDATLNFNALLRGGFLIFSYQKGWVWRKKKFGTQANREKHWAMKRLMYPPPVSLSKRK